MGYDLHITRAQDWSQTSGQEITEAEWRSIIDEDPSLTPSSDLGEGCASWKTPYGAAGWLCWSNGQLYSKAPDPEMLGKMLDIAKQLGAHVQGDEGELYHRKEDHPDYFKQKSNPPSKPWWRFW